MKKRRKKNSRLVPLYISSHGIETTSFIVIRPDGTETFTTPYVLGCINGNMFQVPCDEQIEVTPEIADILLRLIERQQKH